MFRRVMLEQPSACEKREQHPSGRLVVKLMSLFNVYCLQWNGNPIKNRLALRIESPCSRHSFASFIELERLNNGRTFSRGFAPGAKEAKLSEGVSFTTGASSIGNRSTTGPRTEAERSNIYAKTRQTPMGQSCSIWMPTIGALLKFAPIFLSHPWLGHGTGG